MDWQLLGMILGASCLGAAGMQAVGAVFARRRRLRGKVAGSAQRLKDFHAVMQAALTESITAKPQIKAWSGTRPFQVAAVVDEAKDCKSFYLLPVDGHPLPRFEPGQFLTFRLHADPRQKPLLRCYSLSERPMEDYYRVTIKMVRPPSGQPELPAGQASSYFHQRVTSGTTLDVQAPQGSFYLDPADDCAVVLIAGGIGITPILSMVNTLAHRRSDQPVYLFGGFGNSGEHPFREHLQELNKVWKRLHLDVSYSRPMPSDQLRRDYDHRGYVDLKRLQQVLPNNQCQFYVCGPAGMLEQLVPALERWGVPQSRIHYEAFGPASIKSTNATRTAAEIARGPCEVEFLLAKANLAWDGSHESLLELAESKGVPLSFGCRAGNCGECRVSVRKGSVQYVKKPGLSVDDNECLTCIGVPCGDVVLEA